FPLFPLFPLFPTFPLFPLFPTFLQGFQGFLIRDSWEWEGKSGVRSRMGMASIPFFSRKFSFSSKIHLL
ncbi:hypothetical protein, partial [Okeania sp. SIO2B3]|uniref:hypothetical protein n=1 Tax=Okeania sp. SIO2B3 TaxID=2607784 RepID=UPI0025E7C2F5